MKPSMDLVLPFSVLAFRVNDLVEQFFDALQAKDRVAIAACYAEDAKFRDIAFELSGKKEIHAMWNEGFTRLTLG